MNASSSCNWWLTADGVMSSSADAAGKTIGEELARIGYAGSEPVGGYPVHAAYELHIEQGAILERAGKTIGVVTAGQGQRWYEVTLTGVDAHAGTTPMEFRRDALVGAARMIACVDALGRRHAPHARATVGMIDARPNSRNTVPGVDGLSHNEAEAITPEWAAAGADVLLRAVLQSAQEAGR
ncbi:hypothetical protein WK93_06325 [Burkholderia ubonensis]|nr:hypothetical protein WK93_06325 [Burkholderia ubonensis]